MLVRVEGERVSKARLEDYVEAVYILLNLVEPGSVTTYGCLARVLGVSPRLVGRILSMNENIVVTPCHRVVGSRGLGGFSLGVELKARILRAEGVDAGRGLRRFIADCRSIDDLLSRSRGYTIATLDVREREESGEDA